MTLFGAAAVVFATAFVAYTYLGYPLALKILSALGRGKGLPQASPESWPDVTITVSLYNEESQAEGLLESLAALDYPPDKRQILIVSDGSTDRTDEMVSRYLDRGVEFLRIPERGGKTAAENAASDCIRAEIVVNTDASTRILPDALKPLVAALSDPSVGLASGRDLSVSRTDEPANLGESGYVGYEMWIRDLETEVSGIVGASGCFYAIRTHLHKIPVAPHLSRDFAAALKCRENGYRAVSVPRAVCLVPRTSSLRREYGRKVRTMTRGMTTLLDRRALLNPIRHGAFAWMLFSHKVCRWGVPWVALMGAVGVTLLAPEFPVLWGVLAAGVLGVALGAVGWRLGDGRPLPKLLQVPAFGLVGNVAAMHAALRALGGRRDAIWEPTRREKGPASA
jgi:cellulose synthase/poly-beta-1,6-N-acetylglucosamine synthase-like glycosyltransferase